MSQYYNAIRTKNLFDPQSKVPFNLSRSKIDLFIDCPRCFYLDRRLGVGRPPGFPFNLNSAVDTLLKKEFDLHRAKGTQHPLMKSYGIDAIPFAHQDIDHWRNALRGGVAYLHEPTNFMVKGAIDDLWINSKDELIVVDYKATAKDGEISIDAEWQESYKRQMEVYQWLLRKNGFNVSTTGYFVYCNGKTDRAAFDQKLEFDVFLLPYTGNDSWVETAIMEAHQCLSTRVLPEANIDCDYCRYREAVITVTPRPKQIKPVKHKRSTKRKEKPMNGTLF
ncbi:MAG: PD-(D/E)XK nuclease family protein [Patescibacteria group bacterium]